MSFWPDISAGLAGAMVALLFARVFLIRILSWCLAHPAIVGRLAKDLLDLLCTSGPGSDAAITRTSGPKDQGNGRT